MLLRARDAEGCTGFCSLPKGELVDQEGMKSALTRRCQSICHPTPPPPDPARHHQPPYSQRRSGRNSRAQWVHPPRHTLQALRRHIRWTLEQGSCWLLDRVASKIAKPAFRSTPGIPPQHRKPGCRFENISTMAPNNGVAAVHQSRISVISRRRQCHELQVSH